MASQLHPESSSADKPAIVAMSSHVVRGTVGNRAMVFALESLGFPVWSVPTVTLPWHPGHGPSTRLVPEPGQFSHFIDDLAQSPKLAEVGAIVTGYFGAPSQVEDAARLVRALKAVNPSALYACDPVVGDGTDAGGRLYQPGETLDAIREHLIPLADIATPNRFELQFLTGLELTSNQHLVEAAATLGPRLVLVTSAFAMLRGGIGNLLVDGDNATLVEHRRIDGAVSGMGDLTAAVLLARLMSGASPEKAVQATTAAVYEILARTTGRGADELTLETDAESLKSPLAMVQMRQLGRRGGLIR